MSSVSYQIKFRRTRQMLFRSLAWLGGTAAVCAFIFLFLMTQQQTAHDEETKLEGEINSLNAQIQETQRKYTKAADSITLYEQLKKGSQTGDEALARVTASKLFDAMKRDFKLSSLNLKMTPIVEEKDMSFRKASTVVVSSTITLNYKGLTDEYVFSFLNAVLARLPGYVRVDKFTIEKYGPITDAIVAQVERGGIPELSGGEMILRWYNLKEIAAPPAPGAPNAAGGG